MNQVETAFIDKGGTIRQQQQQEENKQKKEAETEKKGTNKQKKLCKTVDCEDFGETGPLTCRKHPN